MVASPTRIALPNASAHQLRARSPVEHVEADRLTVLPNRSYRGLPFNSTRSHLRSCMRVLDRSTRQYLITRDYLPGRNIDSLIATLKTTSL